MTSERKRKTRAGGVHSGPGVFALIQPLDRGAFAVVGERSGEEECGFAAKTAGLVFCCVCVFSIVPPTPSTVPMGHPPSLLRPVNGPLRITLHLGKSSVQMECDTTRPRCRKAKAGRGQGPGGV